MTSHYAVGMAWQVVSQDSKYSGSDNEFRHSRKEPIPTAREKLDGSTNSEYLKRQNMIAAKVRDARTGSRESECQGFTAFRRCEASAYAPGTHGTGAPASLAMVTSFYFAYAVEGIMWRFAPSNTQNEHTMQVA